jgi:DNA-binding beta-propeller fold protein YncE
MRLAPKLWILTLALLSSLGLWTTRLRAIGQEHTSGPLRLVDTIPMPNLKGRIDHMDVDVKGKRLFLAGLENGSVEVIDLQSGKWVRTIPGFKKPQGVCYVAALDKLFVASGDDGMLRIFRGGTLALLDSIRLDSGANRVMYDTRRRRVYVGYDRKDGERAYGEIGIIDATHDRHIGDIEVASHPAEILLDGAGRKLFVLLPRADKVQVVDSETRQAVASWPVSSQRPGDAALDRKHHRLFIGTHTPPQLIAMDSTTGKEVTSLPTVEGMDGVAFDAVHKRVYVSGGRGFAVGSVYVYDVKDADHYERLGQVATRPGAGTSFWSPELNRYYVGAPAHDSEEAAVLVYEPVP